MGIGVLRLMEHKTNNASRLILRNDMGKVGRFVAFRKETVFSQKIRCLECHIIMCRK